MASEHTITHFSLRPQHSYNSPNLPGLLPKSSQGSLGPSVLLSLLFRVKYGLKFRVKSSNWNWKSEVLFPVLTPTPTQGADGWGRPWGRPASSWRTAQSECRPQTAALAGNLFQPPATAIIDWMIACLSSFFNHLQQPSLIEWLIACLSSFSIDWLPACPLFSTTRNSHHWLIDWLPACPLFQLIDCLLVLFFQPPATAIIDWLIDCLLVLFFQPPATAIIDWLIACLSSFFNHPQQQSLIDWLIACLSFFNHLQQPSLIDWLIACLSSFFNHLQQWSVSDSLAGCLLR